MRQLFAIVTVAMLLFVTETVVCETKDAPMSAQIRTKLYGVKVPFVENAGQFHPDVAFSARTFGGTFFVTKKGELILSVPQGRHGPKQGAGIWEVLEGTLHITVRGEQQSPARVSYFKGDDPKRWKRQIPTYRQVTLGEVYEGIELALKAYGGTVEKVYTVKPGADPSRIRMSLKGADKLVADEEGRLHLDTGPGTIAFSKPVAFQEIDGKTNQVMVAYMLTANGYGFALGDYDKTKDLVIDPILQATYLGGTGEYDDAYGLAIHPSSGDVYVAGKTTSTDFPGTDGGGQPDLADAPDVFVARLNAELTTLIQATYFGGMGDDEPTWGAKPIAFHPGTGDVYVTGITSSTTLPATSEAFQAGNGGPGRFDAFVAWFNQDLTDLIRSTFFGGYGHDYGLSIRFHHTPDMTGSYYAYVTGMTEGALPGILPDAYQPLPKGGGLRDAFVAKVKDDLTWIGATYLGGTENDEGYDIAIGPTPIAGVYDVYVTGITGSPDFPGTDGGAQSSHKGSGDVFIALFAPGLNDLWQATYLGGKGTESTPSIAVHPDSLQVYVAGTTESKNFPCTHVNAMGCLDGAQMNHGGGGDAFVARLYPGLSRLLQASYLGGSSRDEGLALAISPLSGKAYVYGYTDSKDFPHTKGGVQPKIGDAYNTDAFVARFSQSLTKLEQATYLGGSSRDLGIGGVAIQPTSGDVYVAGQAISRDFPGTTGGAQPTHGGGTRDTFVARLDAKLAAVRVLTPVPDEIVATNSYYRIEWMAPSTAKQFLVQYSLDNGAPDSWRDIAPGIITDTSYIDWHTPTLTKNMNNCLVKVMAFDDSGKKVGFDTTDGPFTIEVVTLTSPNGEEEISANSSWLVTWRMPGTVIPGQINLYLSTDGGLTYKPIEGVINPWDTTFSWTPGLTRTKLRCKLKIKLRDSFGPIGSDVSDRTFKIVAP